MIDPQVATLPISVIIPAFNRREMIVRAIHSVAAQTPATAAEVIVVDDASSDDTASVARAHGASVVRHDRNRGAAAARNTGFSVASQPWVALLDSDDEWLPHHLATLWRLRGDHVLVAASALGRPTAVAPRGARAIVHGVGGRHPRVLRSPGDVISPQPVSASAVMVRTDVVNQVGGHDTGRRYGEDWDLWLRVLEHGTGVVTPSIGAIVHLHAGSKHLQGGAAYEGWRAILHSYSDRPWYDRRAARRWESARHWDLMRHALRTGDRSEAWPHARALAHPGSALAVVGNVRRRAAARRRASTIGPNGRPTLALLPGAPIPDDELLDARDLVNLAGARPGHALIRLARRPTAEACVRTELQARLLGALNITPIRHPRPTDREPSEADGESLGTT